MRCWLVLFFLIFSSCTYQVPKDSYTVVQNLASDPDNLNPILSNSGYASAVIGYIYEQLFDLDNETLKPKPKLAKSWEISSDGLQYTFHLRDDIHWQDGKKFTADDVIYTFDQIKNPKNDAASSRNYFNDIVKIEKLDEYGVRFICDKPYVGALYILGLMTVIPKHIFDDGHDFNMHPANRYPMGTGPFQFVEWKTGSRVLLKKFDAYWGIPYHVRNMLFKIIPDSLVAFRLFKKRDLDLVDLSALQWARQTDSKKFRSQFVKHKLFTPFSVYSYIGWNLNKPYFADYRVRLALAHLLDLKQINEKLQFGLSMPVTGPFHPLGKNYNKSLPLIHYDPELAKKLLDEAGWIDKDGDGLREKNGVLFHFTMLFGTGSTFAEQLMPILQKNFREVGIDVELRRLEAIGLFKQMHDHDFDAYFAAWGRGAGIEDLYQIWHSSQIDGGSNYVSYANPEVDRLLAEARREFEDAKRAILNKQIHEILYHDQPYLFMFTRPELIARDKRFQNVREYPSGLDMREWVVKE